MDVSFEGEAYPSEDERRMFGYEPERVYILDSSRANPSEKQRFSGSSTEEILDALEDGFLGFSYVNAQILIDQHEADALREVPAYQQEAVPAEFYPGQEWIDNLREIESINSSVTDSEFSAVFHNEGKVRDVEKIDEEVNSSYFTAFPDITGVSLVTYNPPQRHANLMQYNEQLIAPKNSSDEEADPPLNQETDFRKVDYPRNERAIRKLMKAHEDWDIVKQTLPSHETPPEI